MAIVLTNDYFFINGVRCDTVGLSCDTPPVPPMAAQRYTTWETGADMSFSAPDDSFQNITYSLTAYVFKDNMNYDNSQIYEYLMNAKTLSISRLNGYYFKVRGVSGITPTSKYDSNLITYKITFSLAPFKYFATNNEEQSPKSSIITNPGTRYSRPLYRLYDFSDSVDEAWLRVNNVNAQFVVTGFKQYGIKEIFVDA